MHLNMTDSIPFGYLKQVLSSPATTEGGGGYISDKVLEKWMEENRSSIGSQSSYRVCMTEFPLTSLVLTILRKTRQGQWKLLLAGI